MRCLHYILILIVIHCHMVAGASPSATIPWNLEDIREIPEYEWGEGDRIRSLYYRSEPFEGKATRVFACYATPGSLAGNISQDMNLPGIVLVHGGGGKAFPEWVELWASRGYAAIAMDLAGCGPDGTRLPDGGPGQGHKRKFESIDLPITEQWQYHAVANVIRAHSLLLSFPETDPERTAITGLSWGGFLTCVVAGLDNRFKAAVPIYGCGFLHEHSMWDKKFEAMSEESRAKWGRLWDASQYVGSATVPILFINGGKDGAFCPDSYARTYDLVKSDKNIMYVPELEHGHIFDKPKAVEVFIDHHLKGGVPLPKITSVNIAEKEVTAVVDAKTKLVSARLHYTLDKIPGNPKKRVWTSVTATIQKNKISADLPPTDATIWFVTVTDERDAIVSSEIMLKD